MASEPQIKILIVEDHPLMTGALRGLLATQPRFDVIAEANDVKEALRYACLPGLDLVLMDISLTPEATEGIDLTVKFRQEYSGIKVLIYSMHDKAEYVQRAKQAGAHGYVIKSSPVKEILRAIHEVIEGNQVWPTDRYPASSIGKRPTPAELQVLKYINRGMTTAQIAVQLAMMESTVSRNRYNICQKFDINTQPKLFKFAEKCMKLYGEPPDLDLRAELDQLVQGSRKHPAIPLEIDGEIDNFNTATNMALYRVAQEVLGAIRRHPTARKTSMQLKVSGSWINLTICDSAGFKMDPVDGEPRSGLCNPKKILEAIGGELVFTSSPDGGTAVTATVRRTTRR